MKFYTEDNVQIRHDIYETHEQNLVKEYIKEDDIVLELGARYGTVSCLINSILKDKKKQVVVEPDKRVWDALQNNKEINNCEFNIVRGFISNKKLSLDRTEHICQGNLELKGYGSTFIIDNNSIIDCYTLEELENNFNMIFNTLVIDCEGFFMNFLMENKKIFVNQIKKIIIEEDYKEKCDYDKINIFLKEQKFECIKFITDDKTPKISYRVWVK